MERVLPVNIKKVHFVGIGGIGMSGLAGLLLDKGYVVSGSDLRRSQVITKLKRKGAKINIGHSSKLVRGKDLVCFSSAIKRDNPEIKKAKTLRIPILRRGALLGRVLKSRQVLAIAGSHGKTTTTSLASFILRYVGEDVATLVGGIPHYFKAPSWWGKDLFVVETDESDGSFLKVRPKYSIITNIDKEHLCFYGSFAKLRGAFLEFAKNTQKFIVGCSDQDEVIKVLKKSKRDYITVGLNSKAMLKAKEVRFFPDRTLFKVYYKKRCLGQIESSLLGIHNILNALGVLGFCLKIGYDLSKVKEAFKYFSGTKRRLDFKAQEKGVVFVDDYAHHPKEIASSLSALKPVKKKRQVVLFQPHRFSRVRDLITEFSSCFKDSDLLIITDIYSASEKAIPGVDAHMLIRRIKRSLKKTVLYVPKERLTITVPLLLKKGDCLVTLGAGDNNKILEQIIKEWKKGLN